MNVSMKTVSNLSAVAAVLVVVASFVLNALKITTIDIGDAIKVGAFIKGVFLTVDGSIWLEKITGANRG